MASAILPILGALFGGASGLFGSKPKPSVNTTDQSGSTSTNFNNTSSHPLTDLQETLAKLFTSGAVNQYNQGPVDLSGYEAGGLKQINDAADLKKKVVANTLASRGLSYSPYAAAASASPESERVGQGVDFLSGMPLLQRQLKQQDLQGLIGAFGALPTNTINSGSQQGTSSMQGASTGTAAPQNPWANLFSGLGSGLFAGIGANASPGNPLKPSTPNPYNQGIH